jgi:mycothiol system anti-sigma-R factor
MSEGTVKPIDCLESGRRLWAYLDGELEPSSAAQVEQHLEECTRCFGVCQTQRRFLGVVRDLPSGSDAAPDLLARVKAALQTARVSRPAEEK